MKIRAGFCVSCAYPIGETRRVLSPDPNGDWMKYYRALYLSEDGAKLSEVCFTQYSWAFEEFYGHSEHLYEMLGPWYKMADAKPCEARIFHESCWTLFRQYFEHDVDLDKLFEVCQEVSSSARDIYLYEKLSATSERDRFPASQRHTFPLKRPEVQGLLASKDCRSFPRILKKRKGKRRFSLDTDCFRKLPLEMRTEIAVNLSTSDFLTLRQSSRSMAEVFGDQLFWKSRFIPSGDRGFLSSLLKTACISNTDQINQGPGNSDWRSIYRCTAKIGLKDGHLLEFKRQWQNNQWLRQRYTITEASEKKRSYRSLLSKIFWKGSSYIRSHYRCGTFGRRGAGIGIWCPYGNKCILREQAVLLNDSVASIEVYVLQEGAETFITGFGLMERGAGNQRTIFGYRIPDRYMVIDLDGKKLMGFNVRVVDAGIHAIQPIFEDGLGRWTGDSDIFYAEQKELTADMGVKAFSGQFDYCRMSRLAIA